MAQPTPARTKAFISYSHKDKEYLEEFQDQLKFLQHRGLVDVFWADTEIKSGDVWRTQIKAAIASARVAIFLVSPAFFASDFISSQELPPVLEAARAHRTVVLPVILDYSLFEFSELANYQTINDPNTPLASLSRVERNKIWVQMVKRVMEALQPPSKTKEQWVSEGNSHLDVGRYHKALECYEQAIKLDPRYDLALAFKGWALNSLKRRKEALAALDQALGLNSNLLFACVEKGIVLRALGQEAEGKQLLEKAAKLSSDSTYDWADKGWALNRLGRYEEALEACNQSLALNPKMAEAWNNKGAALMGLKRYEEVLAACDQALKRNPRFSFAWANKGIAFKRLGREEESKAAYRKARELGWKG
ncbi:MAG TPA: toll/interleukin-1 receptor domain-containing protein [Ktedonobacterales bacterium]|jgi:tetratricopeptide (TPR) repeat protein